MIGQTELVQQINDEIENGRFAQFSIFIGPRGCGKKLLADEVGKKLSALVYTVEPTVDSIRKMIRDSYKLFGRVCYVIADVDNMSVGAKNSVLKVLEEPPKDSWFIMTAENLDNVLATVRSRGRVYTFGGYSDAELMQFADDLQIPPDEADMLVEVCDTMGDMVELRDSGVTEFFQYVEKVIDHIASVSGANALKIGGKIALDGKSAGYSLRAFWLAFMAVCRRRSQNVSGDEFMAFWSAIRRTGDHLSKLGIRGVNKKMLFDSWVFDIRDLWRDGGWMYQR